MVAYLNNILFWDATNSVIMMVKHLSDRTVDVNCGFHRRMDGLDVIGSYMRSETKDGWVSWSLTADPI